MTIFVSLAAYMDKLMTRTVRKALEYADRPDQIHFGIVDQRVIHPGTESIHDVCPPNQLNYLLVDPKQSRGCCWARNVAMSLYNGEDYFLQIDSHSDFDKGWDTYLIKYASMLDILNKPAVFSSYPPSFHFTPNGIEKRGHPGKVLYTGLTPGTTFRNGLPDLGFSGIIKDTDVPIEGFQVAGGFIFGPGQYVNKFPYDPRLYFLGEEQTMSIRLYTHGWKIYHIPGVPIYHLYNTGDGTRTLHWDKGQDDDRGTKWWTRDTRSKERFMDLVYQRKDLGAYGLGQVKTLEDFANWSGIDYIKQELRDVHQSSHLYSAKKKD